MSTRPFLSPIALAGYEIRSLSFEVDPAKAPTGDKGNLSLGIGASGAEDDASHFMVELTVTVNPDEPGFAEYGYRLSARIAGFFALDFGDDAPSKQEQRSLLLLNGSAVLYSTARAVLTGIARQSSLRDFTLPTVNMHEFLAAHGEQSLAGADLPS
jgi:preprotein translocase subunit SecB